MKARELLRAEDDAMHGCADGGQINTYRRLLLDPILAMLVV
jgi:hypothetical protein